MADIILNDEDILLPFTEETPVHESFMNPIINCINKNTTRSKENTSAIGQLANKEQEAWRPMTLLNGWVGSLRYRKNQFNELEIFGNLSLGTNTVGTVLFELPSGYIPNTGFSIGVLSYNANDVQMVHLYIGVNGAISIDAKPSLSYIAIYHTVPLS